MRIYRRDNKVETADGLDMAVVRESRDDRWDEFDDYWADYRPQWWYDGKQFAGMNLGEAMYASFMGRLAGMAA